MSTETQTFESIRKLRDALPSLPDDAVILDRDGDKVRRSDVRIVFGNYAPYTVRYESTTPAPLDPSKAKAPEPGDTLVWTNSGIEVRVTELTPAAVVFAWANGAVGQLPWSEWFNYLQPAPEPEPEWLVGDVADITVHPSGVLRAVRARTGDYWAADTEEVYSDDDVEKVTPLVVIDPAAVDWRGLQSQMSVLVVGAEPFKRAGDILAVVRRELGIEATS